MWQAEADTVCFACHSSGRTDVNPGEQTLVYGSRKPWPIFFCHLCWKFWNFLNGTKRNEIFNVVMLARCTWCGSTDVAEEAKKNDTSRHCECRNCNAADSIDNFICKGQALFMHLKVQWISKKRRSCRYRPNDLTGVFLYQLSNK